MTLADLLTTLRQLSESEKLELVRLLAADLCSGMNISPFEPFKTYYLPTPYSAFGAGSILMQAMAATEPLEQ